MDKLTGGLNLLLLVAALTAIIVPIARTRTEGPWLRQDVSALGLTRVLVIAFLAAFALGWLLHLDSLTSAAVWFLGGLALSAGLHHTPLTALGRGAVLLLVSLFLLPATFQDPIAQLHLTGWLGGLVAWKLTRALQTVETDPDESWEDLLFPVTFLIGKLWLAAGYNPASHDGLLPVVLSVALLLRTLQVFNLPIACPFACGGLMAVIGGLATWLGVQTLIPQLNPLNWVLLFGGGILLASLLAGTEAASVEGAETGRFRLRDPNALIRLLLIGVASLVASRLFGTLGWAVLGVAALVVPVTHRTVAVAALFWLGRTLLQSFLAQYNPNVTGINIVHPYATAALYAGLVLMLVLPAVLETLPLAYEANQARNWRTYLPATLLVLTGLFAAGLANFFLHAEAVGSLLVAALVGGTGIALVYAPLRQSVLMAVPLWLTTGCLLLNALIESGNSADKSLKLTVLGVAFVLVILLGWLNRRVAGPQTLARA